MKSPPDYVIACAIAEAKRSPCAKSKRGAAIFAGESHVLGRGFNGQPEGFSCTDSHACHKFCSIICMHAEARAIFDAVRCRMLIAGAELVHVKVVNGALVDSGGPSCVQCSRLVVDAGVAGVWLYELDDIAPPFDPVRVWRFYGRTTFHRLSLEANGIHP